jgi:hypothetical protein
MKTITSPVSVVTFSPGKTRKVQAYSDRAPVIQRWREDNHPDSSRAAGKALDSACRCRLAIPISPKKVTPLSPKMVIVSG